MTIAHAEYQTAGRGQGGNRWESAKGLNLTFSVKSYPVDLPVNRQYLMLEAGALAVYYALSGYSDGFSIKWPNDIYWKDYKISGTLSECSVSSHGVSSCILGTGINVNIEAAEFAPEIRETATSLSLLAGHPLDRRQLLADILQEMETLSLDVQAQGFAPVLDEWRRFSLTLGQEVRVIGVNETFTGRAVDIDADGALLVDTETGRRRVLAADVSIRPADARQGR